MSLMQNGQISNVQHAKSLLVHHISNVLHAKSLLMHCFSNVPHIKSLHCISTVPQAKRTNLYYSSKTFGVGY